MVFDEGPSFEGTQPQGNPHYIVSWTELVSRTFTLWSRKLISYLTIAIIPVLINIAIQVTVLWIFFDAAALLLIGSYGSDPLTLVLSLLTFYGNPVYLIVAIPLMLVSIIVSAIVAGAVIKLALDNYGAPEMGDAQESISFALGRIGTIIAVQLISSFIMAAFMIPGILLFAYAIMLFDFVMILNGLVLMLIGLPVGFYLSIRLAPSTAVVVAEDHSAIASLKRAFTLSSGQFWHIFAGTFLLAIVVGIIGGVIGFATTPILFGGYDIISAMVMISVITIIISTVTIPLSQIFYAVLYRDLAEREYGTREVW